MEELIVGEGEEPCCPMCCAVMKKLPHTFGINMGVGPYGYFDETLGKYIGTNRERREECRRQGVTPKGETPKEGDSWV